jgi:hypothetical protein
VTNEIVRLNPSPLARYADFRALANTTIGADVSSALLDEIERIYPAAIVNSSADTSTYPGSHHPLLFLLQIGNRQD